VVVTAFDVALASGLTTGPRRSREVQMMTSAFFTRPAFRFRIPAAVLAAALTVAPPGFEADDPNNRSRPSRSQFGRVVHPAPIEAALNLLRWAPKDLPVIEVVEVWPPRVGESELLPSNPICDSPKGPG
jgi:hypothetical protein